ncbi:MAG TPA: DUF885 domain-containing protein [Polyangiaceae bacterium]|nr:DUF885 domain-containing protein [Polyangiaceae bacterium]
MKQKGRAVTGIGLLLLAAACAKGRPGALPSCPSNVGFARLVDDYFDARFAFAPTSATSVGLHDRDAQLEDRSAARIRERIAELKRFRARFGEIDRGRLSFDDAIDAEALANQVEAELLDLEILAVWEKNPMGYAGLPGEAIDALMKRDFAPRAARLRVLIERLRAVPAVYAAARANVHEPPHEFTDLAIRMSKGSIGFFERSVAEWAHEAAGADTELRAAFDRANAAAVAATRAFTAWLETDLAPRSRGSYAIGADHFRAKLKFEEMVEEPLDALLARGEAQLAKDHAAFVDTARRIDPGQEPAAVIKRLSDDHPTSEDLIPSVKRSLERARQFLVTKDLVTIPSEVRPHVEETPPYARSGGFASMDTPGPYESRATEAFYYVTPVEQDWDERHREEHLRGFNTYVVASINVHEAYPGHYLQFLYAPRFPTKTRKLVAVGTNAEGWAHYAEQMMVDQGFGDGDPRIRLTQLQEALLRDCRYVVGIKLHTKGMSVEDGARFFVEQGFIEPANAYEEARRGAYNPTYLYYTLGKLEIQKLRDEYLARPAGGSLKAFHDAFVAQGGLPLPLMRRILLR